MKVSRATFGVLVSLAVGGAMAQAQVQSAARPWDTDSAWAQ